MAHTMTTSRAVERPIEAGNSALCAHCGEPVTITDLLQEVVSGVRLVKSFGGERYEDERFGAASHRYSDGMVRINRVSALSQPLTEVIGMRARSRLFEMCRVIWMPGVLDYRIKTKPTIR